MHHDNILASVFNLPFGFLCGVFIGLVTKMGFMVSTTAGLTTGGTLLGGFAVLMFGGRIVEWFTDSAMEGMMSRLGQAVKANPKTIKSSTAAARQDTAGQITRALCLWSGTALGLAAGLILNAQQLNYLIAG